MLLVCYILQLIYWAFSVQYVSQIGHVRVALQDLRLSTPLSQYSLPLIDIIDSQRFQIWSKIVVWKGLGYDHHEEKYIEAQVGNDLFPTDNLHSFCYLMDEYTAKFLLSL